MQLKRTPVTGLPKPDGLAGVGSYSPCRQSHLVSILEEAVRNVTQRDTLHVFTAGDVAEIPSPLDELEGLEGSGDD